MCFGSNRDLKGSDLDDGKHGDNNAGTKPHPLGIEPGKLVQKTDGQGRRTDDLNEGSDKRKK